MCGGGGGERPLPYPPRQPLVHPRKLLDEGTDSVLCRTQAFCWSVRPSGLDMVSDFRLVISSSRDLHVGLWSQTLSNRLLWVFPSTQHQGSVHIPVILCVVVSLV